jgi:hypothetical protein
MEEQLGWPVAPSEFDQDMTIGKERQSVLMQSFVGFVT